MKFRFTLSLLLLSTTLCAQDGIATEERQPDPKTALAKSIAKMTRLNSVTFRTTESQDSAMTRAIAKQVGGAFGGGMEQDVRGSFADGMLHASLNDDADEILTYRGRLIARNDDVGWKLRRNRLAAGNPMPFVLDPSRFFEALEALPAGAKKIQSSTASTYKDKAVLVISLTLDGEAAQDFALSGALPAMSSGMGGGGMIMRMAGGAGMPAPKLPELTVDLALYVEPATGYVHKVKSRTYQKSDQAGQIKIAIQGGGLGGGAVEEEDEEDEVEEKDKDGKRIYKRGLPVRKLTDDLSRMDFDIILTKHGQAMQRKLDAAAKKLLRIPQ